jgi:hypothetical protein
MRSVPVTVKSRFFVFDKILILDFRVVAQIQRQFFTIPWVAVAYPLLQTVVFLLSFMISSC